MTMGAFKLSSALHYPLLLMPRVALPELCATFSSFRFCVRRKMVSLGFSPFSKAYPYPPFSNSGSHFIPRSRFLRFLVSSSSSSSNSHNEPGQFNEYASSSYPKNSSNGEDIKSSTDFLQKIANACDLLASVFPLWILVATATAIVKPAAVNWVKGPAMVFGLALTMLGMGTTLTIDDFKQALLMPKELISGVILQYTIMPICGSAVAFIMGLPPHYAVGLILVACCPGGTASNIVTYLARGNVALSVLMTAASTIFAVFMTPYLTGLLAGKFVPINGYALFLSTFQVILIPVALGTAIKKKFPHAARMLNSFSPLIAVISTSLVVSSAISSSLVAIRNSGLTLFKSVFLLHFFGFFLGYLISKLLKFNESVSRTVSIEVGMQNSVLGVVLATQNFSNPLTAAPCALSSLCHSLMGSMLAGLWRMNKTPNND